MANPVQAPDKSWPLPRAATVHACGAHNERRRQAESRSRRGRRKRRMRRVPRRHLPRSLRRPAGAARAPDRPPAPVPAAAPAAIPRRARAAAPAACPQPALAPTWHASCRGRRLRCRPRLRLGRHAAQQHARRLQRVHDRLPGQRRPAAAARGRLRRGVARMQRRLERQGQGRVFAQAGPGCWSHAAVRGARRAAMRSEDARAG